MLRVADRSIQRRMGFFDFFDGRGLYSRVDASSRYTSAVGYLGARTVRAIIILTCIFISAVFIFGLNDNSHVPNLSLYLGRSRSQWIEQAMSAHVDDPVDMDALGAKCASMNWNEGLNLKCHNVTGGIGNVRNRVLDCLRFAIEAGGIYQGSVQGTSLTGPSGFRPPRDHQTKHKRSHRCLHRHPA